MSYVLILKFITYGISQGKHTNMTATALKKGWYSKEWQLWTMVGSVERTAMQGIHRVQERKGMASAHPLWAKHLPNNSKAPGSFQGRSPSMVPAQAAAIPTSPGNFLNVRINQALPTPNDRLRTLGVYSNNLCHNRCNRCFWISK